MKSKYSIYIYHVAREDEWCEHILQTDNPKEAIESWMKESSKHPTMVAIDTTRYEYAKELLHYARNNISWLKDVYSKNTCPYKWDYIKNGVYKKDISFKEHIYYDKEYAPDQIFPFCLG